MNQFIRLLAFGFVALIAIPAYAGHEEPAPAAATEEPKIQQLPVEQIIIQTQAGQDYTFDVEMARSGAEHSHGLMYRKQMNEDSGMLFLFGSEHEPSFWMKNTYIPLDMLFIAKDGTINHIHHSAQPQDETKITTDMPALAVLEINGGLAGSLGIKEGDKIIHPSFHNELAPH